MRDEGMKERAHRTQSGVPFSFIPSSLHPLIPCPRLDSGTRTLPRGTHMLNYLYVALGSAAGGLARVLARVWLQEHLGRVVPHSGAKAFPIGTLLVNVTGSFIIGVLIVFFFH